MYFVGPKKEVLIKNNLCVIISEVICYDDACHLKKFANNPIRNCLTSTTRKLHAMDIVCDRFHFKNHIDKWCKEHCNPYNCGNLKVIICNNNILLQSLV